MGKHAYLLMAHQDLYTLEKLLRLLDYPGNDIFLHIDIKSEELCEEIVREIPLRFAGLYFISRMNVQWGGYSMIICELNLLREAILNNYDYYHLLSGVDLPIKKQSAIHLFFDENHGKEFIGFSTEDNRIQNFIYRVKFYYPFQDRIGRNQDLLSKILRSFQNLLINCQKLLQVNRSQKSGIDFYKGSNWFSISHEFALHVLSELSFIKKHFSRAVTSDELFLQTIFMKSSFKNRSYGSSLREIDWQRGNPHTYRLEDIGTLMSSENLFARKFDSTLDRKIIDRVYDHTKESMQV